MERRVRHDDEQTEQEREEIRWSDDPDRHHHRSHQDRGNEQCKMSRVEFGGKISEVCVRFSELRIVHQQDREAEEEQVRHEERAREHRLPCEAHVHDPIASFG